MLISPNVSTAAAVLAIALTGMAQFAIGMFLAAPITAVVRILLARHVQTRPLAELMSRRLDEDNHQSGLAGG